MIKKIDLEEISKIRYLVYENVSYSFLFQQINKYQVKENVLLYISLNDDWYYYGVKHEDNFYILDILLYENHKKIYELIRNGLSVYHALEFLEL